jgi:hypothetical protein
MNSCIERENSVRSIGFAVLSFLMTVPAQAATDWNAATAAWRVQYRELAIASAAVKVCDVEVAKPVRKAMDKAREGLRDALVGYGPVENPRALVKAAGGEKQFCGNTAMIDEAKATIAAWSTARRESGNNTALPLTAPVAGQPVAANAPTPVVDPNTALIRNCRKAVIAKLGKKAEKNEAFWPTYETCMKDQGAGWF